MPIDKEVMDILLKLSQDVAATKNGVDNLTKQNEEIFDRLHSLEESRAKEQGRAEVSKDMTSRWFSIGSALLAAAAAVFSARGGHVGP